MDVETLESGFTLSGVRVFPLDNKLLFGTDERLLSPIAMDVLCELASSNPEPVSKDYLLSQIWGSKPPAEGTLEGYIRELNHVWKAQRGGNDLVGEVQGSYKIEHALRALETQSTSGTPSGLSRIEHFLEELQRRKVSQTGVLYLVAAWLLLQFSDASFEALGLGDDSVRLILITAVIGFPITLLLSWFYDVKPADGPVNSSSSSQGVGYVLIGALIAIPLAIAYQWYYTDDLNYGAQESELASDYVPQPNSIAVLAFNNLSGDTQYDYLGDGIAEEIINALSSTGRLLVAPRTSSFLYKNNTLDMRDIGKQLGVQYMLEGSVRRINKNLRVIATLVNVSEGFQTWSRSYNQGVSHIFDVQQDISRKVVQSLNIVLSSEKDAELGAPRTLSVDAYDAYLQGLDYLNRPVTQSSLDSAISLFGKSIELDSEYSDAYAGLCEAYLKKYVETKTVDWFTKAENSCTETLRFDLNTVELRVALGNLYLQSGEYQRAVQQLEIALERDPQNINSLSTLAKTRAELNQTQQAETLFLKAIDIQPRYWKTHEQYGNFLFETGRPDKAVFYYRAAIDMTPDNAAAYNNLGAAYMMSNRFDKAAEAWQESLKLEDNESASSNAGTALFLAGEFDEAASMYRRAIQISKDKHILWGNYADALWFGSTPESAKSNYETAILLAEESLEINPNDRVTQAALAHYLSRTGAKERATQQLLAATADESTNLYLCLLYTSPSPRDGATSRMPSSA